MLKDFHALYTPSSLGTISFGCELRVAVGTNGAKLFGG